MFSSVPVIFGVIGVFLGLVFIALVIFLLRSIPKSQPPENPSPPSTPRIASTTNAVVLVQSGGRVKYINQAAREVFGLLEEEPTLERLARRTRPENIFVGLCAAEGQARFTLNGMLVEGTSYSIPYPNGQAILVSLCRSQVTPPKSSEAVHPPGKAIDIFSELNQKMSASLDLQSTIKAVLESVERLVVADATEVTIWDPENQYLIPYRLIGLAEVDRRLEKSTERYKADQGYSGYLISHRSHLLIGNIDTFREVRPAIDRKKYPFCSYLGIPLLLSGEFVGTLELASLSKNAFTDNDIHTLQYLASQAAAVIHNASLYENEQHRVLELSGLAQLFHRVGSLSEPRDLFSLLIENIKPLLDVEVMGFWNYDENQQILEACLPFIGIPAQFLSENDRITIKPGSQAEAIIKSNEIILSLDAWEDPQMEALGIVPIAQAAGFHHTIFLPLISSGKLSGYFQAADKKDGSLFDQNDRRLLLIIASQAAMIINNATLVQQTQKRAQRSEALRRIASLTGSSATLDEILKFSLIELARLFQADAAMIFLLDENRGEFRLHKESLFGVPREASTRLNQVSIAESQLRQPSGQQSYITGNAAADEKFLQYYRPQVDTLGIQSAIKVPLTVRNRCIGIALLASRSNDFFEQNDMILMDTAAAQLAGSIEQSSLFTQTDQSLRRRVDELTALTHISRELNTTLDLEYLLQRVYDELVHTTRSDCGSIVLFASNDSLAQTYPPPEIILQIGDHHDRHLSPMELYMLERNEPLVIRDFESPVQGIPDEVLAAPHIGIRSALVVPIVSNEHAAGLIHLHSRQPETFDETSQEIVQALAIQAVIALNNAQRYQEQVRRSELLNQRVVTVSKLLETTQSLSLQQPIDRSLEAIAYGIQESTPFNIVLIHTYDPIFKFMRPTASAGLPLDQWEQVQAYRVPWTNFEALLQPELHTGQAYKIKADQRPLQLKDNDLESSVTVEHLPGNNSGWDPADCMVVPLLNLNNQLVGLINVEEPRNGKPPDQPTLETLDIFAHQAALIIESYTKLEQLIGENLNIRQEVERAHQAIEDGQRYLPALLHKDLEQTLAIQNISQRAKRVQAGLDIAEIVNRQLDTSAVLEALGQEIQTRMDLDFTLIAVPSGSSLRLVRMFGNIPAGVNLEALLGQKNPVSYSIQTGEILLISDINNHSEWGNSALLQSLDARSFISLPVPAEPGDSILQNLTTKKAVQLVEAVVLGACLTPAESFTEEDRQLFNLLARQTSKALQNLRLLEEAKRHLAEVNLLLDFSRKLESLDTQKILQSLLESVMSAIPAAQAGLFAFWDAGKSCLVPQVAAGYHDEQSILGIIYHAEEGLPAQALMLDKPIKIDDVNFAKDYNLPAENLLRYRKATEGRLPLSTLIIPVGSTTYVVSDQKSNEGVAKIQPVGVLILENYRNTAAFTSEDQVLSTSLAQQTALALENARLYQASEQRARQMQALTNVSATITSSLQSDELIALILDQAYTVIPFDTGTLWLREGEKLTIRAARGFIDSEDRAGLSVAVEDSALLKEMIITGKPIHVDDIRGDPRFPSLIEHPYLTWLGVPLISKGEVIGVIAIEKCEAGYYTPEHIQAANTFAGQAAVALENAKLYEESQRRAAELDQRSRRLALLNRLSTELNGSLGCDEILQLTIHELFQAIHCSAISAVVFDIPDLINVRAEFPETSPHLPISLPDATVFSWLRETLGVLSLEDVLDNEGKISHPLIAPLSDYLTSRGTRGLLIMPLTAGNDLNGLLFIHNDQPYRFSSEELELTRTISNQAAFALQNASLFTETQLLFAETRQRSAELASLFELGVNAAQVLDQKQLIELAFQNILSLLNADEVLLILRNENGELTGEAVDHGDRIGPIAVSSNGQSFSEYVIKTGQSLIIGDISHDQASLPVTGIVLGNPARSWMGVPLIVRGTTTGALSVQSDQPEKFNETHHRLLKQVGNQLAVALENARLFSTVQNYASSLEERVTERTAQLAHEHQRTQTLLGIITELSSSLDMDLVLNRTLALINESTGAEHSLLLLASTNEETLQVRASLGYLHSFPVGNQDTFSKSDDNFAGWVITKRLPLLIDDARQEDRWKKRPDIIEQHRSALAVPLLMGEDALGVLMLFHRLPGQFSKDQLELVQATAKQIAVAINNAQLFTLIRDQAERLGDMLRTQHIETSRSQAILEAVADGVLVTDANRVITLFNASAGQILGLKRQQIVGQSLEAFSGLFGKSAQTWMETIRAWSDPAATVPIENSTIYSQQIELDDKRIVSVHLAPVLLRKDFLGTVSIFQDITHQVEVDRLKSEFVATVSHELRTPMTSIKGYVEVLLMGAAGELSDKQTHFLEIVKANTERLAILVNDLLDISRIEAGRITLSLQPLDLREIASQTASELELRCKEENKLMRIITRIPSDLPRVLGDPERVHQILDNLVENAYFYTQANGQIVLSLCQIGNEVQVDVQDNGIGILPNDQPRIFERFYRGEDPLVLATSGTGLGLSIVQRLVEMHNGRIWFESSGIPGEGSIFTFTLPIYEQKTVSR